jgi:integrase
MSRQVPNLKPRNGIWETRIQIPKDVQAAYGKTVEQVSHGTTDFDEALAKHGPIAAAVKRRIKDIRAGLVVQPLQAAPPPPARWSPDDAHAAMHRWAKATIDAAYLNHFHGSAPIISRFGDEAVAIGDRVIALRDRRYNDVANFDATLVNGLVNHGIDITASHPALPNLRLWFAESWLTVEKHLARFRDDDFSQWSLEAAPEPAGRPVAGEGAPQTPGDTPKLHELLEAFLSLNAQTAKVESEMRTYVRRLVEHLGDIPIGELKVPMLDAFLVKLRYFPNTKRPDILKLPFDEIIERYGEDDEFAPIGNKTIRVKWFGAYNQLASFAVDREWIAKNPVTKAIPKKKDDTHGVRDDWSAEQIKAMFAKPLFTGCASLDGNRDQPGKLVAKDAKFWLPILALWSGMRLGELGAMRADEVRHSAEHDVWYFDLTERPLKGPRRVKNVQSQRVVPVHQKLIDLGFIKYAQAQKEWLFPDLPHAGTQPGDTTKLFSKWFGRWWRENGLQDPTLVTTYHSYRHNFVSACRIAEIAEDVRDRLTGHAGAGNQKVSRGYGKADLGFLKATVNKVQHSTFSL